MSGAEPEIPEAIFQDGVNHLRQIISVEGSKGSIRVITEPVAFGADPKCAVRAFGERGDDISGETILGRVGRYLAIAKSRQTVQSADP